MATENNNEPIEARKLAVGAFLQASVECSLLNLYDRLVQIRMKQGKDVYVSYADFVNKTIAIGSGDQNLSVSDIINRLALEGMVRTAKFFNEIEAELGVFDE
ncbi:MAG: hypothetical protein KAJ19_03285 [Gammaproteobacteria bacterium]|nr:hypothetical protein [Gammaproteobacteria bacterium]